MSEAPKVLITLAHSLTASHTRSDAGFAVESELGRAVLSRSLRYPRVMRTGGRARRRWCVESVEMMEIAIVPTIPAEE